MSTSIVTTEDLEVFKIELIKSFKNIIEKNQSLGLKKYLKSSDVLKQLKISPGTLQNLRINGTLPYSKIGNIILYDADEIQKVILDNRIDHKIKM